MISCYKYEMTVHVEQFFSLKEKRTVVQRIKNKLRDDWKCCVCESHCQDDLIYIGLTIAFLIPDAKKADETINRLEVFIEEETNGTLESGELFSC
jgi:uncharacterized protein YlxP (DUF503 family)